MSSNQKDAMQRKPAAEEMAALLAGTHGNPFAVLGVHAQGKDFLARCIIPGAETWPRWALIAHGMALAGHDGGGRLGRQLANAGVAESRVTRLLTARGEAFRQLLPRVLRLMASKGVPPNWFELGELVLKEDSLDADDAARAEQLRMRIAGPYFSALAAKA